MTCIHHWMLEDPKDGSVHGSCKHCGGERNFPACLDPQFDYTLNDDRTFERVSMDERRRRAVSARYPKARKLSALYNL